MRRGFWWLVGLVAVVPLSAAAASSPGVPRPTARPLRVMSISECSDQIVLALLPPARITSVTWLSRDPQTSLMARQAAAVAINRGTSEEVLRQRPDLVVAGTFTTTATRQLLKRLGWPLLEVGSADTVAGIRRETRRIAVALGEPARGEALLARMDRQLGDLARSPEPPLRVAAWDGSGFSAARGTLYDTILTLAGATNVAADPARVRTGVPDTELLLVTAPDLLLRGGAYDDDSLRANVARSPIVRRFWGRQRSLAIRQAIYLCGTPYVADQALALRRRLRAVAAATRAPLPFAAAAR